MRTRFSIPPVLASMLGALFLFGYLFAPVVASASPEDGNDIDDVLVGEAIEHGETGHAEKHDAPKTGGGHGPAPVFVTPPESPTKVEIGMFLIGLVEISPPNASFPTFKAEIYMDLEWHDERLAFDAEEVGSEKEVFLEHEAELELEQIWWPDIEFENEQGHRHTESRELVVYADGTVEYSERFQGVFTVDMELTRFPFDHQSLTIHVESFSWDDKDLVFAPLDEKTGYNKDFKTLEWQLHDVHTEVHTKDEVRSTEAFSEYVFSINADRDPGYYLYKIVLPLLLIVAFSYTTFWMPGEGASTRMQRGIIMLLTVVAFHRVVAANLPRIGYLTFMDAVVFISFMAIGLTIVSNIIAQRMQHKGVPEKIERMDRMFRILFPALLFGSLILVWIIYHTDPASAA